MTYRNWWPPAILGPAILGPAILGLVILGLALLSVPPAGAQGRQGPGSGGPGSGGPVSVGTITLATESVPYIRTLPGRAAAFERTDIRPRVNGMIEEVLYQPGAVLEPGAPMFRIEDATYRAAVAAARAAVAGVAAELASARATAERYRALQGRSASATDLQNAELVVAKAEAALTSAHANLETAELNLGHTLITSPIAGVASVAGVSVGTLVTANQAAALATVTRLDPIYVDVSDSSAGMLRVRDRIATGELQPGDHIGLQLLLETGQPYSRDGELVTTGSEVQTSTGTVDMRIRFDNPDGLILPGQFLRVEMTLGTMRAILVPQRATSRGLDGALNAWVVREGAARRVRLEAQGSYRNSWVTTGGVAAGDVLVVDGMGNLNEGATVAPVPVRIDELGVVHEADAGNSGNGAGRADATPAPPATATAAATRPGN